MSNEYFRSLYLQWKVFNFHIVSHRIAWFSWFSTMTNFQPELLRSTGSEFQSFATDRPKIGQRTKYLALINKWTQYRLSLVKIPSFPFDGFWKILIPYSRSWRSDKMDLKDLPAHVFFIFLQFSMLRTWHFKNIFFQKRGSIFLDCCE